jgi:hypothetical protein
VARRGAAAEGVLPRHDPHARARQRAARQRRAALLGRAPSALAHGLRVTPPPACVDLRADCPAVALRCALSLAFMWLYTALISALLPQASGVLNLLARCGFEGRARGRVLVARAR